MERKNEKNLLLKLKGKGRLWICVLGALIGISLLVWGGGDEKNADARTDSDQLSIYSKEVENKILELCSRVDGVKDVSVAVSFESGFEYVYAADGEKTLTVGSGSNESAVRVTEKPPVISGVGIVCVGGGQPRIQQKLINLISAAYGISSNKIYIVEAQK